MPLAHGAQALGALVSSSPGGAKFVLTGSPTEESLALGADECHGSAVVAMEPAEFRKTTRFIVKLGSALHGCGATSQRVERHLIDVTRALGLEGTFMISPTTFTCAFWEDDELDQFIHVERVEPADNNLGRLWELNRLFERVAEGRMSVDEGMIRLEVVVNAPWNYSAWINALSWALIGGSFSALLSPNPRDCTASAVLSLLLYGIHHRMTRNANWNPLITILAPFLSGLLASTAAVLGFELNVPFVILSSIIFYIPGLALTVALTEISARHLISGSSRLVDASMLMVKLFFGSISGVAVAAFLFQRNAPISAVLPELPDWKMWPALLGLSLGLGIAFNVPRRKMLWGLLASAIAFGTARIGEAWFGMYAGMFIGALCVGVFSSLYARITSGPGSILMIQGIVLLVPGSKTYIILDRWISGSDALPMTGGANQAVMVFVSLIAGLLCANAILPTQRTTEKA